MIGNRIAETFFWIGRYTERVANHARLLNVSYHTYREWANNDSELQDLWQRILFALGANIDYRQHYQQSSTENVMRYIAFDRSNDNSIVSCLYKSRDNVRAVRERLPVRMWEAINESYIWIRQLGDSVDIPHAFFRKAKNYMALFHGIAECTMPRTDEWFLMQAGRYIERAENTTRILNLIYLNNDQSHNQNRIIDTFQQLTTALRAIDGLESFRRINADKVFLETVAQFITTSPIFPRSIFYALNALNNNLFQIYSVDNNFGNIICANTKTLLEDIKQLDISVYKSEQMPFYLNKTLQAINHLGRIISETFY